MKGLLFGTLHGAEATMCFDHAVWYWYLPLYALSLRRIKAKIFERAQNSHLCHIAGHAAHFCTPLRPIPTVWTALMWTHYQRFSLCTSQTSINCKRPFWSGVSPTIGETAVLNAAHTLHVSHLHELILHSAVQDARESHHILPSNLLLHHFISCVHNSVLEIGVWRAIGRTERVDSSALCWPAWRAVMLFRQALQGD
jgi:hypothetical protein